MAFTGQKSRFLRSVKPLGVPTASVPIDDSGFLTFLWFWTGYFSLLSCELSYASERLFVTCYRVLLNVLWSKDVFLACHGTKKKVPLLKFSEFGL